MNLRNWMMVAGLGFGLVAAGCGESTEPGEPVDDASTEELGSILGSARADALDIRALGDGRIVFYGDVADELYTLGRVSQRTRTSIQDGLTYAQSPFAYCVTSGPETACVSYLPNAEVSDGALTFGGRITGRPALGAQKAYDLMLAMYYGGYDAENVDEGTTLSTEGAHLECTYTRDTTFCAASPTAKRAGSRVTASFDQLPELGADYVYEGWLIVDGAPLSAGRFDAADEVVFDFDTDFSEASAYILTIEPRVGDDPAPSKTHIVGGDIAGGQADLTIDHAGALGTDFSAVAGSFIIAAPTAAGLAGDFSDKGIWFLDPSGPAPSLDLPELPQGWTYEGWVATAEGPISTGTFRSVAGADSDAGGPAAGPAGAPPFPGQDFVNPPMSLIGSMAVISVEPQPDDSPAPFALKPLVGMIEAAGTGVSQELGVNGEAQPIGQVVID